jgi:uroporphyrinogen-III synthase
MLPPEATQALGTNQLDAVLHYSRRSATTLLRLAAAAGAVNTLLGLAHYCLSDEVAIPLREAGARRITIAPHPRESSLFGLF